MEQFEGQVVNYIGSGLGDDIEGIIVGCDIDIGITLVNNNNKDDYLYCLRGPGSYPELYTKDSYYAWYVDIFESIIEMFKGGFFDVKVMKEVSRKFGEGTSLPPSSNSCAFNK